MIPTEAITPKPVPRGRNMPPFLSDSGPLPWVSSQCPGLQRQSVGKPIASAMSAQR